MSSFHFIQLFWQRQKNNRNGTFFLKMHLRILTLIKMQQLDLYLKPIICHVTQQRNITTASNASSPPPQSGNNTCTTIYNSFRQMTTKN
jgi:hypothetical protein